MWTVTKLLKDHRDDPHSLRVIEKQFFNNKTLVTIRRADVVGYEELSFNMNVDITKFSNEELLDSSDFKMLIRYSIWKKFWGTQLPHQERVSGVTTEKDFFDLLDILRTIEKTKITVPQHHTKELVHVKQQSY